jgi:hypothetical protein
MALACLRVDGATRLEDHDVVASMAVGRRDEADGAVLVLLMRCNA